MKDAHRLTRRGFVKAAAAGTLVSVTSPEKSPPSAQDPMRAPVGFVSHGAPNLAIDPIKGRDLQRWSDSMTTPSAYVVISAHWEKAPVVVGTTERQKILYDFHGFAPELYQQEYDAPAAPQLGQRIAKMLGQAIPRESRGWDHGVWVPLIHMAPRADIPVLQVSLPSTLKPQSIFELGRKLRPLRDENIMILGSGGLVHNLSRLDWSDTESAPSWAIGFESWVKRALRSRDVDDLLDFKSQAHDLRLAHPTLEHFLPLLVALGASHDHEAISFPVEGFEYGSLSRTAVQFG